LPALRFLYSYLHPPAAYALAQPDTGLSAAAEVTGINQIGNWLLISLGLIVAGIALAFCLKSMRRKMTGYDWDEDKKNWSNRKESRLPS
jgi:hypothetical protein